MLLWLHLEQTSGTAAALVQSISAHAALGTRLHPRAAGVVALLAGGTMALSAFAGAGAGAGGGAGTVVSLLGQGENRGPKRAAR